MSEREKIIRVSNDLEIILESAKGLEGLSYVLWDSATNGMCSCTDSPISKGLSGLTDLAVELREDIEKLFMMVESDDTDKK